MGHPSKTRIPLSAELDPIPTVAIKDLMMTELSTALSWSLNHSQFALTHAPDAE